MRRLVITLGVLGFAATGCGTLGALLLANANVTVRLVNDADFNVDVILYTYDHADAPKDVITTLGTKLEFTLAPGDATSFTRACGEIKAVFVDNAKLHVFGDIGPEAESNILRKESDYTCGDRVTFRFDHDPNDVNTFHVATEETP